MKKLLFLLVIILVGCKDSAYLENTCIKEEVSGHLHDTKTYVIKFKNDVVDIIDITHHYQDSDVHTISSIKTSYETRTNIKGDVLVDNANEYKIIYHLDNQTNDETKELFQYQDKRSQLVSDLENAGYTCK